MSRRAYYEDEPQWEPMDELRKLERWGEPEPCNKPGKYGCGWCPACLDWGDQAFEADRYRMEEM